MLQHFTSSEKLLILLHSKREGGSEIRKYDRAKSKSEPTQPVREAIKKKTKFGKLSEKGGGGSAPQPNFLSMKSMDMCIEGRGVELLVQTSFLYKSLFCRSH